MSRTRLHPFLAALTLTLAATFAAVPDAGAAVHRPETGAAQARTAQKARSGRWPAALTHILRKAGIEIDPNGLIDNLIRPLTNGHG